MRHHDKLRSIELFKNSTFLYIFENNLGKEHDHLRTIVHGVDRIRNNAYVLFENPEVIGFHTFANTKLTADDRLQDYIASNSLRFIDPIVSVNENSAKAGDNAKDLLITQIANMKEFVKQHPNGQCTRIVTSIYSEDGTRLKQKDDVQRALSNLIIASTKFLTRRLPVDYDYISRLKQRRRNTAMSSIVQEHAKNSGNKPQKILRLLDEPMGINGSVYNKIIQPVTSKFF